ncbi:LysR family transcriptional regulator [Lentzea flaviverrucosa]|uniref:DNA-binding transcriptional regulator, LysR family n=1 Tax=Lentzea flaviverrucosa TaxID=200379 RepID=A0A1H9KD86_9PSEU|nr:LysR family transcriptional regulator [Lentzea flaviverrucosa]RDI17835.1 DNA-binding transcriptional LysR family regulator [Lentzea flaviverrucosa]SEQ97114.1 DNA-binding transcriptional regulator, LysR family [Lentzea flaviverrucosa]
MELLHLRYFVAVAEELNFSAAARKLHMAASPLSQRIKDLEHELGRPLFDRSTHHVALTDAGTALLPIARDVLDRVGSIRWRLDQATHAARSTVFVGIPAGVHPVLRERLTVLAERVSGRFEVKRWPGTTTDLVAAVKDGRLALTLARLPVQEASLDTLHVMSERLGAVVPADRFEGRKSVKLADLTDLAYAKSPEEIMPAYFEQLDRQLRELGIKKRIQLSNTGYQGTSEIVSGGLGFSVSMLDEDSSMRGYQLDNMAVLPFEDFRAQLDTGLLWRRDRASGGDIEEIVAVAKEVFAEPIVK